MADTIPPEPASTSEKSAWAYLLTAVWAPVMLLLLLATVLWGSPLEKAAWSVPGKPIRTYLTITSVQLGRLGVAWAAWTWGGWLGVLVAVTLALRILLTAVSWFGKWMGAQRQVGRPG